MGHRATLGVLLALTLAGCGQKPADAKGVVGNWTVDTERVRSDFVREIDGQIATASEGDKLKFERRKEERLAALDAFRMKLSFESDGAYVGTMVTDGKSETTKGTWKKVPGGWRLTPTQTDGKPVATPKGIVLRMEDGQLVGGEVPEYTFHFNRD